MSIKVQNLGTVRLVEEYDESFMNECLEAVICSFLHTVSFVRALGPCEPRDLQYLHYDFDHRLYVSTVNDPSLHFRIASVSKMATRALQNDLSDRGKGAVQLHIDIGVTDSAHRDLLRKAREQRRQQRAKSLWHRRKNSSGAGYGRGGGGGGQGTTLLGSLAGWVSSGTNDDDDDGTNDVAAMLDKSTDALMATSPPVVVASDDDSWHDNIALAEHAFVASHSFTLDSPSPAQMSSSLKTFTEEEQSLLSKAVLKELKKRAIEDDRLCKHIWEQWRLEIRVHRKRNRGGEKQVEVFELDDFEEKEDEMERARGKGRYAKRVRDLCSKIMFSIVQHASINVTETPPITKSGVQQPACWPLRFNVCRDCRKRSSRSKTHPLRQSSSSSLMDSTMSTTSLMTSSKGTVDFEAPSSSFVAKQPEKDEKWPDVSPDSCSPPSALEIGRDLLREFVRGGPGYGGIY